MEPSIEQLKRDLDDLHTMAEQRLHKLRTALDDCHDASSWELSDIRVAARDVVTAMRAVGRRVAAFERRLDLADPEIREAVMAIVRDHFQSRGQPFP